MADPVGIGQFPAVEEAPSNAEAYLAGMELIELQKSVTDRVLVLTQAWKFAPSDSERIDVNCLGISLGNPVGTTGGRILGDLAVRDEAARGLLRGGDHVRRGGQGFVSIFERAT